MRLLLIISLFMSAFTSAQNKNEIVWTGKLLTWDDFMGKPEPRYSAASTHYDIILHISAPVSGKVHVFVNAVFFKNRSWKRKNWINDEVLEHEQKHFDIVELFARKLRKQLMELNRTNKENLEKKIYELYEVNDKEMDKYQDLYDQESDYSMNGDKQREWNKKIMKEIEELGAYKNNEVAIEVVN